MSTNLRPLVTAAAVLVLCASSVDAQQVINAEDAQSFGADIDQVPIEQRLVMPLTVTSHGGQTVPPIKVTLRPFAAGEYRIGDGFRYEIEIQNTSSQAIRLPTSRDQSRFRRSMSRAAVVTLFLHAPVSLLSNPTFAHVALYGADDVPGSFITVNPGQTVIVRALADWWRGVSLTIPAPWTSETATVRASVHVYQVGAPSYAPVDSVNSRAVIVKRPN